MLVSARRLVHPDNNSTSILILFEDVTDRRRSEAQKDILLAETRHRMKNILGIVRSLASQTEVEGRSANTGTPFCGGSKQWLKPRTSRWPAAIKPI
jgi:hypothetical protein